jgi:hypothetical protein
MHYYLTIGMSEEQFGDLAERVSEVLRSSGIDEGSFSLNFARQLEVVLVMARQNVTEMVAAEMFGVSQSTVSRIKERVEPVVRQVLAYLEMTLSEGRLGRVLIVDGTFIPTGNRPGEGRDLEKDNYSGKHRAQCLNIQVACHTDGSLVAVSKAVPGRRHDAAALQNVGWEESLKDMDWIADTAYIGTNAVTPRKKPPGIARSEADKMFNKSVSSVRSAVEHSIRHLKEWKIIATGYRRGLKDLPTTITLVTRLELFREAFA